MKRTESHINVSYCTQTKHMPFLSGFKNKDGHPNVTLPERAETEVLSNCGKNL